MPEAGNATPIDAATEEAIDAALDGPVDAAADAPLDAALDAGVDEAGVVAVVRASPSGHLEGGGCACSIPGASNSAPLTALLLGALAAVVAGARRRRR